MNNLRDKITALFEEVGKHYREKGLAESEVHQGHDVHAFYRLSQNPARVIHVQGYPGMSSDERARVWARMMDYDNMIAIRRNGGISIGNEHKATVQEFPNFEIGIMLPYNSKVLEDKLAENVEDLH